jgi:hypothetical protein
LLDGRGGGASIVRRRTLAIGLVAAAACVVAVDEVLPDKDKDDSPDTAPSTSSSAGPAPAPASPTSTSTSGAAKSPCARAPKVVKVPFDAGDGSTTFVDVVVYEECTPWTKELGDPPPPVR